MKTTRGDAEAVAMEMDRIAGGHFYTAVRTVETDIDGNWLYYISTFATPPSEFRSLSAKAELERRARANIATLRDAMRRMGSVKSPQKAAASRENGKKGGRPKKQKKPLEEPKKDVQK